MRKEKFKNQNISYRLGLADECASAMCLHAWNSSFSSHHFCIPSMLFFPRDVNNRHLMVIPVSQSTQIISSSISKSDRSIHKSTIKRLFERSAQTKKEGEEDKTNCFKRWMSFFHHFKVPIDYNAKLWIHFRNLCCAPWCEIKWRRHRIMREALKQLTILSISIYYY